MSKRYDKTGIKTNNVTKRQSFNTTIYPEIPNRDSDMFFIAQEGDRLDNLAQRFYKNASLWWYIARANNLKTMNVPAGTSLRIPYITT